VACFSQFHFATREQAVPLAQLRRDCDLPFVRDFHAQMLRGANRPGKRDKGRKKPERLEMNSGKA
jgi:hypothetical protein